MTIKNPRPKLWTGKDLRATINSCKKLGYHVEETKSLVTVWHTNGDIILRSTLNTTPRLVRIDGSYFTEEG